MYGDKLQLYFSITEKCNWKCFYCGFPSIKNGQNASIEYLKEIIPQIKKVTDKYKIQMCIEGGELGLVNESILDYMFLESGLVDSQVKWHIATNGLFMKKEFHKKYQEKIRSILYHVKSDIRSTEDFNFETYPTPIDIFYTVVVHKENLEFFSYFLKLHSDLFFVPHVLQPRIPGLDLLDISYYKEIYEIVKDNENVGESFVERYDYIINSYDQSLFEARRKVCCNNYTKMMVDLVNKKLIRCCISMGSDSIDLTPESLDQALSNEVRIFPKEDQTCIDCIAGFVFRKLENKDLAKVIRKL